MLEGQAREVPVGVDGIRVWLIDLDGARDAEAAFALLAPDEQERARRFAFEQHRRRFTACRAALRHLLGSETGQPPADVRFAYGPAGKPALETQPAVPLHFNVSHSDRLALIAVSRSGPVGVDIEQVRVLSDMDRLLETVFSEAERAELARLPDEDRQMAFFRGWTRKEAYIKARGDRLWRLRDVDVSLSVTDARLLRLEDEPAALERWRLHALAPSPGYIGALCVGVRSA